jgi:hypothetical protein
MSRGLLRNHRYKFLWLAAMTVTAAIGSNTVSADSMRCGKWVVNESMTIDELVNKCGEPRSKNVTKDDVYTTNANGRRVKSDNVTVTERWIYQPTPGMLPMAVVIIDGKIVSLTRAD